MLLASSSRTSRTSRTSRRVRRVRRRATVPAIARFGPVLLGIALVGGCGSRDEASEDGLAAGMAAPDVTFATLDGGRPTLAALADRGAVLVSFWASDCRTCLAEAPELEALRERYAPRGFELVSVAMPYDRPDFVLEAAGDWKHPVALDIEGEVLAAFEPVPGTPTGYLVGRDRQVLARWTGAADLEALERTLESLLPAEG